MWTSVRTSQHRTQNIKTHNRTTQTTKKMSNTDPTKTVRGELVRSPCYSPIQSSPVKVLAVIEERKHLRKKYIIIVYLNCYVL